jgi:hypothetical protein
MVNLMRRVRSGIEDHVLTDATEFGTLNGIDGKK